MELVITIRKEVANRDEGAAVYDIVRQRLEDRHDLEVRGMVTNHFELEEPE